MIRVLFICHGNICRSVMAEYILKSKTDKIYVESRAVSREELGNDIYPKAKECLDKHGIKYDRHYAKQITQNDYEEFDDIFVMDSSNIRYINNIIDDYNHKIRKLCDYAIADPWYSDDFETVFRQLNEGITNYLEEIIKEKNI